MDKKKLQFYPFQIKSTTLCAKVELVWIPLEFTVYGCFSKCQVTMSMLKVPVLTLSVTTCLKSYLQDWFEYKRHLISVRTLMWEAEATATSVQVEMAHSPTGLSNILFVRVKRAAGYINPESPSERGTATFHINLDIQYKQGKHKTLVRLSSQPLTVPTITQINLESLVPMETGRESCFKGAWG